MSRRQPQPWTIVDVDSSEETRAIIPPAFRSEARIIGLNRFTMDQIDAIMKGHAL